jgi:Putative Ig domain
VTGQVGTELSVFITVTGGASSNKLPSFKVVDGRLPPGTKLFDFAGSTGLINGVPTTAGSFTFTVQVKDETRATDTETFTIQILPPEAPTITTEALSGGTVGEFYCCGDLLASGGVQPYDWSVVAGALPAGLELPKGGEHHLGDADHGGHVHLHRPRHRRAGRLQRQGALHHDQLSVSRPRGAQAPGH